MERYLVLGCHGRVTAALVLRASIRKGIGTAVATAAGATSAAAAAAVKRIDGPGVEI